MKRAIVFLIAAFALVACSKEMPITDTYGTPDAPNTKPAAIDIYDMKYAMAIRPIHD